MKFIYAVVSLFILIGCVSRETVKPGTKLSTNTLFVDDSYSAQLPISDPKNDFEEAQRAVKRIQNYCLLYHILFHSRPKNYQTIIAVSES